MKETERSDGFSRDDTEEFNEAWRHGEVITGMVDKAEELDGGGGFISLDCGLPVEESPYVNEFNGLTFTSDSTFIQTGKSGRVNKNLNDVLSKQYLTLRYFPEGKRNCYSLDVKPDTKYLIAVSSVYGNYDGLNLDPSFDIYIGRNKWISTPRSNSLDICLVKTGTTSPIISAIEIQPLRDDTYVTQSGSLRLSFRVYLNNSAGFIRYPDDVRDRIWDPFFGSSYTQITTDLNINNSNAYEVPKTALQSAATPRNASGPLVITWNPKPSNAQVYLYMHFAEIQTLEANETREFDVILKGNFNHSGLSPTKDFSNNNLTGPVPSFLASMKSLTSINFSGNNLNGSVPQALLDRVTEGHVLKLDGNPDLCKTSLCNPEKQKKKFLIPAFASAASLLAILVVVALILVFRKKKIPSDSPAPPSIPVPDVEHTSKPESSFASKKIRFTYTEVQEMTNNFDRALGEGGFGVVYHGRPNMSQVANGLKECLISENSRISESRDVELRTSMDYSKDMYTEVIPEAR
ncbi:hypothetical protein Bca4012_082400 [Brassica carinata]